tara:strand:+ start:217 stop:483 length:267 start_codon:yes stop_codon:yes gene_type:complete
VWANVSENRLFQSIVNEVQNRERCLPQKSAMEGVTGLASMVYDVYTKIGPLIGNTTLNLQAIRSNKLYDLTKTRREAKEKRPGTLTVS